MSNLSSKISCKDLEMLVSASIIKMFGLRCDFITCDIQKIRRSFSSYPKSVISCLAICLIVSGTGL